MARHVERAILRQAEESERVREGGQRKEKVANVVLA